LTLSVLVLWQVLTETLPPLALATRRRPLPTSVTPSTWAPLVWKNIKSFNWMLNEWIISKKNLN
jgi:hypothetical protein